MNNNNAIYFPGLNGLRAIAALAVVISHITLWLKHFNLDPGIFGTYSDGTPRGLSIAGYGVSIFFVLSGFLITYLLQSEKEMQAIDVKKFYARRILRIWPLYYLYLFIAVITILIFGLDLNYGSLFLYVFYAANVPFILGMGAPLLSHYWSLGVEEQFYLFWPWINKKINSMVLPVFLLIVALLGTKILLHVFFPHSILELTIHVTRFHCMMIGALGAVLYKQENKLFLQLADHKITQGISWFIIFLAAINVYHIASVIDDEIISVAALFLIIGQIRVKNRIVNLEVKPLDFLGKISFGIYVIHPILIFLFSKLLYPLTISAPVKYVIVYSAVISSTILLSYLSYTYIESYFLKFKKRFEVVKSSSSQLLN
jgi:peptidoglycan/LPS O-acetylase OafA/YrhL